MPETPAQKAMRVQREFFSMPEQEIARRLQRMSETLRLFVANATELFRVTSLYTDPANAISIWSLHNRERSHDLQREISRMLHNFVASAITLVEHTRRVYEKHYELDGLALRYSERKDADLARDPLHNFIKDLRNYFLHREVPITTSMLEPRSGVTYLLLERDELERFKEWSPRAVAFLDGKAWTVDVTNTCHEYVAKVVGFHSWFRHELEMLHATELSAISGKRHELGQSMRDAGFEV